MHTVWCGLTATCCAVTENGFMGMGIGAAMTGLRPIVEGMNMGFLLLAYNQISNNAGMLHYTSGGQYKVGETPLQCSSISHSLQ
jgi:pyruvate/2-oxoglutarate/acetoin dehydrogenase E1 component